jgi:hypothetical protein
MSLQIGGQSSALKQIAQWAILGALAAVVISSADIRRYFDIRGM